MSVQANTGKGFCEDLSESLKKGTENTLSFGKEVIEELTPPTGTPEARARTWKLLSNFIHIPYYPPFHRPGWILRYLFGPYDDSWLESLLADVGAGITVGLTLIPQGLSYATLANQQPIQGLYAAILPSAAYSFFGSSMQLAVGPVAVVSLITGELVAEFVPDYATNQSAAASLASEAAMAVGVTLIVLSFFNLGNFIRYISHPVMSGFTSGAACVIGLNQLKSAFGFSNSGVPQQGQLGFENNYNVMRWFRVHWNDRYHFTTAQLTEPVGGSVSSIIKWKKYILREGHLYRNGYAARICFGLLPILLAVSLLKQNFAETPERKRKLSFRIWKFTAPLFPFFGIILAANMAWRIKRDDNYADPNFNYDHTYDAYYLKIVGEVPSGLNFIKLPIFEHNFLDVLRKAIPIALIAYMESYSVSRVIAAKRGELQILNASQELWANGVANLFASFSTAFPVSGSFSRSALNNACGARSPLAKVTTMIVVIVAVQSLTGTFFYIPQAALAAIIFAAIWNLISFADLWEAWKNNKKDFFTMLFTWIFVLTFNTEIGLAAGLGVSAGTLAFDIAFSDANKPILVKAAKDNDGIDVVRLRQDLNFLTGGRVRDFVLALTMTDPATKGNTDDRTLSIISESISNFFDYFFIFPKPTFVETAPVAVVLDFGQVLTVDLTGMQNLAEIQEDVRRYGVKILIINATSFVEDQMVKYGIKNDGGPELKEYTVFGGNLEVRPLKCVVTDPCPISAPLYGPVDTSEDEKTSPIMEIEMSNQSEENV